MLALLCGPPFGLGVPAALALTREQVRRVYLVPRKEGGEPDLDFGRPPPEARPREVGLRELGRLRGWPDWYTERWARGLGHG